MNVSAEQEREASRGESKEELTGGGSGGGRDGMGGNGLRCLFGGGEAAGEVQTKSSARRSQTDEEEGEREYRAGVYSMTMNLHNPSLYLPISSTPTSSSTQSFITRRERRKRALRRLSSDEGSDVLSERLSLEGGDGELLLGEATGAVTSSNGGGAVSRTSDDLGVVGQLGSGESWQQLKIGLA